MFCFVHLCDDGSITSKRVFLLSTSNSVRFLIPLGMALGAGVTWPQFLMANLLPVTLGNIVGGAVAVCGLYSGAFGSLLGREKA